jgi:hypothetical protein
MSFDCFLYFIWKTFFVYVAFTGSTYFTVAVTVERYIAVCWPMRFPSLVTFGRSRRVAIMIPIMSVVLQIPTITFYILLETTPYVDFHCDYTHMMSLNSNSKVFKIVSLNWFVFMYVIPMCSVMTLNGIIVTKVGIRY